MNILVIGGTRFIGIHLVNSLLSKGHKVTIATRGLTTDGFGNNVSRIILERTDAKSILNALSDKYFDVVYDNLAYCSNDVKYLLDVLKCGRYIETSTVSVYTKLHDKISEDDFKPENYPLKWCFRNDFSYDEIKRHAECAIFQEYSHIPATSVRFPYIIGEDDYTKRLYFYVEHVIKSMPMFIDNINERMSFIKSCDAGNFLSWLAGQKINGCINAASYGSISLSEIISYVERKTNIKAVYLNNGDAAPYNGTPAYSLNLQKAETVGFKFSDLDSWIYKLLDNYIDLCISTLKK